MVKLRLFLDCTHKQQLSMYTTSITCIHYFCKLIHSLRAHTTKPNVYAYTCTQCTYANVRFYSANVYATNMNGVQQTSEYGAGQTNLRTFYAVIRCRYGCIDGTVKLNWMKIQILEQFRRECLTIFKKTLSLI